MIFIQNKGDLDKNKREWTKKEAKDFYDRIITDIFYNAIEAIAQEDTHSLNLNNGTDDEDVEYSEKENNHGRANTL